MADAIINTFTSTMHVMDSEALLHPQILDRLSQHVIARLQEHRRHETTVREEQRMRPSMTSRETATWD